MIDGATRRYAAELGRRYFEGTVTFEALLEHFGESDDPLIRAFLEAVLHEPNKGFLGISERQWERRFWQPVSGLLAELEKGEAGQAPRERVYPRVTVWSILGWSLFTLWVAASALDHAIQIWQALVGSASFPFWTVAFHSLGVAMLTFASWAGVRAVLDRLHLYRTRHGPYL